MIYFWIIFLIICNENDCLYSQFKILRKQSTDNFDLFCFKPYHPKVVNIVWFVGFINLNTLKLASEFQYITNSKFQLEIRSSTWIYKEHINFTCIMYFPSLSTKQIPFMQSIYIDVVEMTSKLKSSVIIDKTTSKVSIGYSFYLPEINIEILRLKCLKYLRSPMICDERLTKFKDNFKSITRLPGIPLTSNAVSMDSQIELLKVMIKNEFDRLCSQRNCEVLSINFNLKPRQRNNKNSFVNDCLYRIEDYLGFDSLNFVEFCEVYCSDSKGNCVWKYIFSEEYLENLYPKITHYLLVRVEIKSEESCPTMERNIEEFNWKFNNFVNGFVKRKDLMSKSTKSRLSSVILRPILCIDSIILSKFYKWKRYELTFFGDLTIFFHHWVGLLNLEMSILNDTDLIISIMPSTLKNGAFVLSIENKECLLFLPPIEEDYKNKNVAFILRNLNITHTEFNIYIEDYGFSSHPCFLEPLMSPLQINSLVFNTRYHSKISNFQIFSFAIPLKMLKSYKWLTPCGKHLANVFDSWELIEQINDNQPDLNETLSNIHKRKCPGICDYETLCFICAINTTEICHLDPDKQHSCIIGNYCNNMKIEIGKLFLIDRNSLILCNKQHLVFTTLPYLEPLDYLELFTLSLVPTVNNCARSVKVTLNDNINKCYPGTYRISEDECDRCPNGFYNDLDENNIGCRKCPLLQPFIFEKEHSPLDCSNEMKKKLLKMALDTPEKFLALIKNDKYGSVTIADDPDELLQRAEFFDITTPEIEIDMLRDAEFSKQEIEILKSKKGLYLSEHDIKMFVILGLFLAAVLMLLFALLAMCMFNILWSSMVRGLKRVFKLAGIYFKYMLIKVRTRFYFFRIQISSAGGCCGYFGDWFFNLLAVLKEKLNRIFRGPPMKLRKSIGYFFFWKIAKTKIKKNEQNADEVSTQGDDDDDANSVNDE